MGMLAGVGETIANPYLLIRPFMRREAVLSSRIEGTLTSLSDLFRHEASGRRRPTGDVIEVFNYVKALERGLALLETIPISLRLVNEVHKVLLEGARGYEKRPGELRNEIVWIGSEGTALGEARFVPAPPSYVRDLMEDWERFANEGPALPPLIQCALLHYQIEAIYPYFDGNGRLGRLLIAHFLYWKGILPKPLLYLSAYFEHNRKVYYDQLFDLSVTGNWEAWLSYFLAGVIEQSQDAWRRTRQLRDLQERYRRLLQENRASASTLRLSDELFALPYVTAPTAAKALGVTPEGARIILSRLVEVGIVEVVAGTWPRMYVAKELLNILDAAKAADIAKQ
ncbi:MAG: Fic family protein [Chloroflexi bacterium]|nr:Fic family protein [Chloroflexota bacterium]